MKGIKSRILLILLVISAHAYTQVMIPNIRNGCDTLTVHFNYQDTGSFVATAWSWDFGNGLTSYTEDTTIFYKKPGTYPVSLVVNDSGAVLLDTIYVRPRPSAKFTVNDSNLAATLARRFVGLKSPVDTIPWRYSWDFGDGTRINDDTLHLTYHKFPDAGAYTVRLEVNDTFICKHSTVRDITVSKSYKVPNVFTPNGDGMNDIFIVESDGQTVFTFRVFDPGGHLLFEEESTVISWDGRTSNGQVMQEGVYFYVLKPKNAENIDLEESGFIYLFR